MEFNTVT